MKLDTLGGAANAAPRPDCHVYYWILNVALELPDGCRRHYFFTWLGFLPLSMGHSLSRSLVELGLGWN